MRNSRPKARDCLSEALSSCSVDTSFERMAFRRRKGSLVYKRVCAGLTQRMEVRFDLSPSYEPTAIAHLLPEVRLESGALIPIIAAMTSEHPSARAFSGRVAGLILQQQINNLAPKEQRAQYWFLYAMERANECVNSMKGFMEAWALPFLGDYMSLHSLVGGYERLDQRLPHERRFDLYIAACYVLLKAPRKALDVLERSLGQLGPRKEYSQAFDYVSGLIA